MQQHAVDDPLDFDDFFGKYEIITLPSVASTLLDLSDRGSEGQGYAMFGNFAVSAIEVQPTTSSIPPTAEITVLIHKPMRT